MIRFFCVLLTSLLIAGCSVSEPPPAPVALQGVAFYSMPWMVKVAALPASTPAEVLQADLQKVLDDANRVLSTYQPDTELMRFNAAPVGEWVEVSPMLFGAVQTAVAVSALTGGAYDVTVGPLVDLWGFGPKAVPERTPDAARIAAVRSRIGWQHIGIDPERRALMRKADIQLDLSSVGEGVAVDALVASLVAKGMKDYMVSVAGCTRVAGFKPDGTRWVIAIEQPDGSGRPQQVLALTEQAISTSGSYRNYHEIDGKRYSHTIDPATGAPITHHGVSVSVIAPDGNNTRADALATALNVLGPEKGLALAEKENIPAWFMAHSEQGLQVTYTKAMLKWLPEKK
ncbi:MAG: FAD:protein FMN transferase [Gammaproteobacteria bacterium]